MRGEESEVIPVKNYVPGELHLEELDYSDAKRSKRGMEDSSLEEYYDDEVKVYRLDEAHDGTNVRLPDLVIEKRPNRSPDEIVNAILADELDAGVETLYLREDGDGDVRYGMEFCRDHGMFKDIEFNGFPDFLEHARAVGEAYGPLYNAGIVHGDLIGMRRGGYLDNTPYIRNVMVSGSTGEAVMIDFEDSHFEEEPSPKMTSADHILEMEVEDTDDEYFSLQNALITHGIISVPHFNEIADREIQKTDILNTDPKTGLDVVDTSLLEDSGASNTDLMSMIREVDDHFERGFHEGQISSKEFYRQMSESTIAVDIEREEFIDDAARKRRDNDIEPQVEEWIEEFE